MKKYLCEIYHVNPPCLHVKLRFLEEAYHSFIRAPHLYDQTLHLALPASRHLSKSLASLRTERLESKMGSQSVLNQTKHT